MFIASDIPALLGQTREILVLNDGELAILTPDNIVVRTLDGASLRRSPHTIDWDGEAAEKSGYPHFMLKEIFEQPEAVQNTIRERADVEGPNFRIPELGLKDRELAGLNRLCFVACGASRQVPGRSAGETAGRGRRRLGISLSQASCRRSGAHRSHLPVRGDR